MDETTPRIKSSPRDVFMYLLAIITLYWTTFSILNVFFQLINAAFPDPLNPYLNPADAMRFSLAALIIIFPVYFVTTLFLNRDLKRIPEKTNLRARKWLLYLTLFLAALLIIGDLVALIYSFLNGDLTTPFVLKVVSILIVAAGIFYYYLYDLKRDPLQFSRSSKVLVCAACAIVLAAVIGGIFVTGSPFRQRQVRFDAQKTNDLGNIQGQIVSYWQQKEKLPQSLSELTDSISGFKAPEDPQHNKPYIYQVTGDLSFKLCAEFNYPSEKTRNIIYGPYGTTENWDHPAGDYCFDRTIDPSLYKIPSVNVKTPQPLP